MRTLVTGLLLAVAALPAQAQILAGRTAPTGEPVKETRGRLATADAGLRIELPPASAREKNASMAQGRDGGPLLIGFHRDVPEGDQGDVVPRLAWRTMSDGTLAAALLVSSPQATSVRVAVRADLPSGGTLRFFHPAGDERDVRVVDPVVAAEELRGTAPQGNAPTAPAERGQSARAAKQPEVFWSPAVGGDTIGIEITLPSGAARQNAWLRVEKISHRFARSTSQSTGCARIDVRCRTGKFPAGLEDAVARIYFERDGGGYYCSGTLLNDASDRSAARGPYFLTANHCVPTQAAAGTVQVTWFAQRQSCDSPFLDPQYATTFGGADLLATESLQDATLLRLRRRVPDGVTFAGWDTNAGARGEAVVGIHHPAAGLKRYSAGTITAITDITGSSSHFLEDAIAVTWSEGGAMAAGSSGAGLFRNGYLIGVYSHGFSCIAKVDYHGSFASFYPRVCSFLDPHERHGPCGICGRTPQVRDAVLEALGVDNCAVDSQALAGVETLELRSKGLEALRADDFDGLTSLRVLSLKSNRITTLPDGVFDGLTNLQSLDLGHNQLTTLPAGVFDGLRRLNLDGNAVRDLAPLLALKHLKWLSARGQALTSDSVYVHIPALQARGVEVLFDAPVIATFADAGLRGSVEGTLGKPGGATLTQGDLLGLRTLNAAAAGVADLSGIEMATNLERLDLSGNRLRDAGPLARLPALRWLDLSDNGLADVSALSSLAGLRELLLGGNALADVSPLSSLRGLRALALADNALEDASALSRLSALDELWLAGNRLADLTPLAGLTALRSLHLDGNRVADVSPLRGLDALERLSVNDNALTSLAPVAGLPALARLEAAGNRIAEVRVAGAPLTRLRLDDNRVEDASGFAGLAEGAVVGLRGNPLSAASIETHVPALRARGVAVLAGLPVPFFPAAADPDGRVGFVRVLNRADARGEVLIWAVDDAGERAGPARLVVEAGAAAHFNSGDLEAGNAAKGLLNGVGAPGAAGAWRLELLSTLDIRAYAYVRTPDGFLTAVGRVMPRAGAPDTLRAFFFNPARNRAQRSVLRLLNPGAVNERASVWGVDDSGAGRLATGLAVAAGAALTVDAATLERPPRQAGRRGLGSGAGKWRLSVHARWPVEAASLLESPSGHLANLSAAPRPDADGTWRMPLFPAAGGAAGRQGFLRIANRDSWAGGARLWATDDGGHRVGPLAVALPAFGTVHLNSGDLEGGNAAKGLPVGAGAPTRGDWRLALASDLEIEVASYVRHADGFVTGMHGLASWREADSAAGVVFFNPASNRNQRSLLRLINDGAEVANVVITGVDDAGESGGEARLTIPAGEAVTISADELENGGGLLDGALGDGTGKWRLTVTADRPVGVMSLLEAPTGHLSNLSGGEGGG